MKILHLSFLVLFIIILLSANLTADSTTVHVLALDFDEIDSPPNSFVPHKQISRPRIGLALSGGGARGFAQIGVLQALEKNNIPIDIIVGSSIGSIVGGLYAAGYNSHQIEEITKNIDWSKIMVDKPPRTSLFVGQKQERGKAIVQIRFDGFKLVLPQALTPGQRLTSILTNLTLRADYLTNQDFDNLTIPFRALACDLVSGKKVLLKSGNLAEAMKSSSAVPLLFEPVERENMLLVDGGLINNIPVEEVKEFEVDIIIAIDTSSELNDKNSLYIPWKVADQVTSIMQKEKNAQQRAMADVLIRPDLGNFKSDDFQNVDQIIDIGKEQAQSVIKNIKHIFKNTRKPENPLHRYSVQSIKIFGVSDSSEYNKIHSIIKNFVPQKASLHQIKNSMKEIYQLGTIQDIRVEYILNDRLIYLKYLISMNPRFSTIKVCGNSVISDSLIQSRIKSKSGVPINYYQSKNDIKRITTLYKDKGYAFINLENIEINCDTLNILINEGIISSIDVLGNKRTKDFAILREFPLKKGDIFNLVEVDNGLNNIYSTNLFKTVSLSVKKVNEKAKLTIEVEEKPFHILRFGYHYDLIKKNNALFEIVDENFLGLANPLFFQSQYGTKEKSVKFKYRADRIINTFLTGKLEIYHQQENNYVYDDGQRTGEYRSKENGISLSVGQQIERLGILSIIASVNNVNLDDVSGYSFPTGTFDMKTIALQSIVDTQDQYPFPNYGKYYTFLYKMSSAQFLNSQVSFFKFFSTFETFYTFLKRNTVHYKVTWGTSDLTTPFIEQFRLGGVHSFYGLQQDEKIGKHMFAGSIGYRYKFPFGFPVDFYFSMRYDVGATWKNNIEIKPDDFNHGLGASLTMNSFVGPISLSIGKTDKGKEVFYFSAGFDF